VKPTVCPIEWNGGRLETASSCGDQAGWRFSQGKKGHDDSLMSSEILVFGYLDVQKLCIACVRILGDSDHGYIPHGTCSLSIRHVCRALTSELEGFNVAYHLDRKLRTLHHP